MDGVRRLGKGRITASLPSSHEVETFMSWRRWVMVGAAAVALVIVAAAVLTRIYHEPFAFNLMLGLMLMAGLGVSMAVREWRSGEDARVARLRPARADE